MVTDGLGPAHPITVTTQPVWVDLSLPEKSLFSKAINPSGNISLINPKVFPRTLCAGPKRKLMPFKWEFGTWSAFVALKLLFLQKINTWVPFFQPKARQAAMVSTW